MEERNSRNPVTATFERLLRFSKNYLPLIIIACTFLVLIIIVIGAVTRAVQQGVYNQQFSAASAAAEQAELDALTNEAASLLEEASDMSRHFDYAGAVSLIETFSGDLKAFPELSEKRDLYRKLQNDLVLWTDPDAIPNLSFHMLIADPQRAFESYSSSYVTTAEFHSILQQLYANNYILVKLSDFASTGGFKGLYLPAGKKPLVLTQTGVNYYNSMIDSDGDYQADAGGSGFASKLIIDDNGNITCEMVDSSGETTHGAYDLIPVLDSFVETHPDFSYRGAKAVIAFTGFDGIFGYRTNREAEERLGKELYEQECASVSQICKHLQQNGYELAYYGYSNTAYSELTLEAIEAEMQLWKEEMHPLTGFTNIFAFCKNTDIGPAEHSYTDEKFNALYNAGFRYFLGFCQDGEPWFSAHGKYIRQGRLMVTGGNMKYSPHLFTGLFDPDTILDPNREL